MKHASTDPLLVPTDDRRPPSAVQVSTGDHRPPSADQQVHSVTGLHVYYYYGHLCDYQLRRTVTQKPPPITSPALLLLLEQGRANEERYVAELGRETEVVSVKIPGKSMEERAAITLEAMRAGVPVLHNGVLDGGDASRRLAEMHAQRGLRLRFRGETDLLVRVEGSPSAFGDYAYRVIDVKSSRTGKFPQMMQVAYYDWLLRGVQGTSTGEGALVVFPQGPLGEAKEERFSLEPLEPTLTLFLEERLPEVLAADDAAVAYHLAGHCSHCLWHPHCAERAAQEDDLSRVPGLRPAHKRALAAAGAASAAQLAAATDAVLETAAAQASGGEGWRRLREQAVAVTSGQRMPRAPLATVEADLALQQPALERFLSAPASSVYVRLGGDPIAGLDLAFGVQVGSRAAQRVTAEHPREEDLVFGRFVDGMERVAQASKGRYVVFHYGRGLEDRLRRWGERHGRADRLEAVEAVCARVVDVQALLRRAYYLPHTPRSATAALALLEPGTPSSPTAAQALEQLGLEPPLVEAGLEAVTRAAGRVGVPRDALLSDDDELLGVWFRLHLETAAPVWLRLVEARLTQEVAALAAVVARLRKEVHVALV